MSKCFQQKRIAKRKLSQDGPCTPGSELRWDSPGSDACRLHSINAAYGHHHHHHSLHNHPNPRYPHYHHHHLLIYIHTIIFGLTQRTLIVFIILLFIIILIIIIYWWNPHHNLFVPSLHVSSCWSSSSSLNQEIHRFYFCPFEKLFSLFLTSSILDSDVHHPTKTV